MQLIPNPTSEFVSVNYNNLSLNTTIEVYNLLGKLLDAQVVSQTDGNIQLDTSRYPAGLYIVVAKSNGLVVRQEKLIIK